MEGVTLKSRAIVFAMCSGAVAFILALAATSSGGVEISNISRALIPAIVCAVMCWASTERSIAGTASAIDAAIARLAQAAQGDLSDQIPPEIATNVPQLATAMHGLFAQLNANLDSVQRLAMFDPVTGLANRTNFRRTCERLLSTMPTGAGGALFFIDLDRFKAVNDTMGHACGDMLLGMVANRLRAVADSVALPEAGSAPLIGRLAGDEFTMFFAQVDSADAARIGRAVLFALAEPFDLAGTDIAIGASIGIALRPDHGETLTDLMRAADAAMYHAKSSGRGRAEHFSAELAAQITERAGLESALRDAIDRDEFALVFQPQLRIGSGQIVAAEALLRWRHPQDGLRLPGTFLPRAEETGLIVEIGDWVVHSVAETIARWSRMGIEHRLAVNVSPRQLDHASFFRRLRAAMHRVDAPARLLELEITETLAMHCSDEVLEAIALLRADGATIAIDDFGTGYSSLAYLQRFRVKQLKIDRFFTNGLDEHGPEGSAIVSAIIALAHSLEMDVVAEGVETESQLDKLKSMMCDEMQGFLLGKPLSADDFSELLRERMMAA